MSKSTILLHNLLSALTGQARAQGLSDAEWSRRARVRKETLSRLRARETCDLETLRALAEAIGARIAVMEMAAPPATPDSHFPAEIDRNYEERLAELCLAADLNVSRWRGAGPPFFMAGLAVMLASVEGFDRRGLLALGEQLHPGASDPEVFARWLERSPVRPSRFLPQLTNAGKHAA
jgi:hypothetical protein